MRFLPSVLIISILSLFLFGCSSTQFKNSNKSVSTPDASRITVISINTDGIRNLFGARPPPGNIWLDGQFMGDFTSEASTFSEEVTPGSHTLEICQKDVFGGKRRDCMGGKVTIAPNAHQYYQFTYNGYSFNFSSTRIERYQGQNSQTSNPSAPNAISSSTPTSTPSKGAPTAMDAAKKKCIELGFKVGTESFGNCVLKVAN